MTFAPFSQILIHSPSSLSPHPLPPTSSKGKFQGLAAQASCKTCSSQAGGGNKFQGEEGQATCNNECPQFTAPTSSQDACICVNPCPKGTFGSSPTCTDCPLGRYFVAGKKERRGGEGKERESGRAEEDKSETHFFHAYACLLPNICNTKYILILPPLPPLHAHFTPSNTAVGARFEGDCGFCPLGRWSDTSRASSLTSCKGCPAGKIGAKLSSSATRASISTGCVDCVAGESYQDATGQASCIPHSCPRGTYAASSASTETTTPPSCAKCPQGRYSGATGLKNVQLCNPCALGRYATEDGRTDASHCLGCPAGKKGKTSGSASILAGCTDCVAGEEYQDATGQVSCIPHSCPKGTYAASSASTETTKPPQCDECPAGRYSGARGLTSVGQCNACPTGMVSDTYSSGARSAHC